MSSRWTKATGGGRTHHITGACRAWNVKYSCAPGLTARAHPGLEPERLEPLSSILQLEHAATKCAAVFGSPGVHRTVWFIGDSLQAQLLNALVCLCAPGDESQIKASVARSECLAIVPGPRYRVINCSSMPIWPSPRFEQHTTFTCYSILASRACFFEAAKVHRLDAALASFLADDPDETTTATSSSSDHPPARGPFGDRLIGQLLAPAKSDDVLIANLGLHHQFDLSKALPHLRTALYRAAQLAAARRRRHGGAAPHLLWRQTMPQHFPGTVDGAYPTSDKRFASAIFFRTSSGCVPLPFPPKAAPANKGDVGSAGAPPPDFAHEPWMTQPVVDRMDPIVRAAAISANETTLREAIVIPAWWACRERANDHMGRWRLDHLSYDCTHFCEGCAPALNQKLSDLSRAFSPSARHDFHSSCAVDAPPSSCLEVLAKLTLAYVAREVLCAGVLSRG
jgi:hypothetical protein